MLTDSEFLTVFPRGRDPRRNPRACDVLRAANGSVAKVVNTGFGWDPPRLTVVEIPGSGRFLFTPSAWHKFAADCDVVVQAEAVFTDPELVALRDKLHA